MDVLRRLLGIAIEGHYLAGFMVGNTLNNPLMVSHLLFVDRTFILCGNNFMTKSVHCYV